MLPKSFQYSIGYSQNTEQDGKNFFLSVWGLSVTFEQSFSQHIPTLARSFSIQNQRVWHLNTSDYIST